MTAEPIHQRRLRQAIENAFNESELQTLCFDLGIEYEALPPGSKLVKARELVALCLRKQRINELITLCEEARPKIDWRGMIATAVSDSDPPFMGLKYFDADHANLFFGRETLTAQLTAHLQNNHFLAVVGASGSGKSSLVRAGLVPALQTAQPTPKIHVFTPTDHPLEALATTLTRHTDSIGMTAKFIDAMASDSRSLHLAARRLVQGDEQLFLVIDQFEELFTLCRSEEKRQAFVDNLVTAVSSPDGEPNIRPTRAVIALRADFYHHCAQYDALRALLEKQQRYIGAMSQAELRRAIEMPAKQNGLTFEDGLVDLLLRDVGATAEQPPEPGALPLLSHALLETWRRREGNTLTFSGYSDAGGVQGAIAKTAESVFTQQLTPDQQTIARSIFLRLTELVEGTQDTRRRALISELLPTSDAAEETQTVLNLLSAARLVTTDEESAEVTHEALIREWPTLRHWLDENREGLRVHRHLTESAYEWSQLGRDPDELYRGNRLEQAAEWATKHDGDLNDLEREFLTASMANAPQKLPRLLRNLAFILLIGFGIIGFGLFFFFLNELRINYAEFETRSSEGASESMDAVFATMTAVASQNQSLDDDNDKLTNGEEAIFGTNPQNQDTDEDGLDDGDEIEARADPLNADTDNDGRVDGADEDPIRPFIIASNLTESNLVEIISLAGQDSERFAPQSIAIGPAGSGTRLIAAGRYGDELTPPATIYLWRLSDGQLLLPLQETTFATVHALGFSADNLEMYAITGDTVTAWALDLGEQIWQQNSLSAFGLSNPCSAAFAPDGATILVGGRAKWGYFLVTENGLDHIDSDSQNYNTNACYTDAIFSTDGAYFGLIEDEGRNESVFVGQVIDRRFARPFNKSVSGTIDMTLSPDNNILALGFEDGRVELYDYAAQNNAPPLIYPLEAHPSMAHTVFSPDGTVLATSSPEDGTVRLWRVEDGERLLEIDAEADGVTSLIFSPDGHYLLFGTTDGKVHVYGMPEVQR